MVEAILWDNDGVLVDTEGLFFEATRDALARAQVILTREVFLDFVMGNGRSVFELVEARGWTPDNVVALRSERDAAYAALLRSGPSLAIDGIAETLQALHGRARMAVVTSSLREHFELAHRHTGMKRFFEVVVAREDYETIQAASRALSHRATPARIASRPMCRNRRFRARPHRGHARRSAMHRRPERADARMRFLGRGGRPRR